MLREIVLDTETTGLDPEQGHRLVEVAALELVDHLPTGRTFHSYLNPERDMPEDAFRVHGLSAVVPARLSAVRRGGRRRCWSSSPTAGWSSTTRRSTCASSMPSWHRTAARPLAHGPRRSTRCSWPSAASRARANSLDALCRRFAVDNSARTRHGALLDCELLAEVYLHLIGGRQIGLGLDHAGPAPCGRGGRPHRSARPAPMRLRPQELAAHAAFVAKLDDPVWLQLMPGAATRHRFVVDLTAALQAGRPDPDPVEPRDAEDQGAQPDRRARRGRDDPDHLADDQGQADPALSRRRAALLRPRRSSTATPPTTR